MDRKIIKMVLVVFFLAFALVLGICFLKMRKENTVEEVTTAISTEATQVTTEHALVLPEVTPQKQREKNDVIDFKPLKKRNEEIYAWITIPGTNVDYPIVQSMMDNEYYLHYNVDHEEDINGAIFTQDYNEMDFLDPNTIVYGHNMRNGSMFRTLHNFEDKAFFDKHRDFVIYTEDYIFRYKIFAAYAGSDDHILFAYDFDEESGFDTFIKDVYAIEDGNINRKMKVTTHDHLVTLSTCNGAEGQRYFVIGVLQE